MKYKPYVTRKRKRRFPRWALILGIGICIGILLSENQFLSFHQTSLQKPTHKFYQILQHIQQDYVDTTALQPLTDRAIAQMVEQLDPHSSYITAQEQALSRTELEGAFTGIGIEFVLLQDTIYVVAPIAGGPADKAGIQPGDQVIFVNGQVWAGQNLKLTYILENLRGPQGSQVKVTVKRPHHNQLLDFTLTRDKIQTHSIHTFYMVEPEVGYMRISRFTNRTYEEFVHALDSLQEQGMKKLIIDLQNNPGGYLDQAVHILEQILEKGKLILYTQGKNTRYNTHYYAQGKNTLHQVPIIILINEGSASASEILAGALQDHDRALIVGRRSFGKGLVQRPIALKDGSQLRLTIARYYTPSGRFIQKPYDAQTTNYELDLINRYQSGELFHADSIYIADSSAYKTTGGRTVYGGGGIMPDYFVALDTTQYNAYLEQLLLKYVLQQYALEYAQTHKDELSNMTYTQYCEHFTIKASILNQLFQKARSAGIKINPPTSNQAINQIKLFLKAYIARKVWKEQGFYPLINQQDNLLKRAMQLWPEAENLVIPHASP